MESLYRSLLAAARCPRGAIGEPAFYFIGTEVTAGFAEDRWLDRARGSRGGSRHRRRGSIQIEGARGVAPADGLQPHLVPRNECLLRLLSKRLRDGAPSDLSGGGRSWRSLLVGISGAFDAQGSVDLIAISILLRPFVLNGWSSFLLHPCSTVYLLYWLLTIKIGRDRSDQAV